MKYTCKYCGVVKSTICEHEKGYPDLPPRTHTTILERLFLFILGIPLAIVIGFIVFGWVTIVTDIPVQLDTVIMFVLVPAVLTSFALAIEID